MTKVRFKNGKFASVLLFLCSLIAMAFFLAFPVRYTESVREGVSLWAISVLPATFPFLFLTALFTRNKCFSRVSACVSPIAGGLFAVSGAGGSAALLSALSGYPVGARAVSDLYLKGYLPKEEAFRTACLATTTGPMFLVGAVGARMFHSALAGWLMLISHLVAVWAVCVLLRIGKKSALSSPAPVRGDGNISDLIYEAVISILCVGGAIALFYAFGQMLTDLGAFAGIENQTVVGILRGLLEMTSGCACLAAEVSPLSLATACFLVTFGGLCVIVQQWTFLSKTQIKLLPFLGVKLVQGALAGALCFALCLLAGF